jgi:hypothetical protein
MAPRHWIARSRAGEGLAICMTCSASQCPISVGKNTGNDVQFVNFAKELSKGVVDSVGRGLGSVL